MSNSDETVPWPIVTRYTGGGAPEGVLGRVWLRIDDTDREVEYLPAPVAREPIPPARGQKMRDAGFTPRDTRLTCDECGAKFTRQFAPLHECEAPAVSEPSSRWPFEQPHVARDLLARLYMTMGRVRDAKLEAKIDVFLAATRRP